MVTIETVKTGSQLKEFIQFPNRLYKSDPCFVPELYISQKEHLSKKKNPFFLHSTADYYLARKDGEVVGRIAAIFNSVHTEIYKDNTGFFGFFDTIDSYDVAEKLLNQVKADFFLKGIKRIVGPENFTTNDPCGILIDGFDIPPIVLMPYNKKYYATFLERIGFRKLLDLYSYRISVNAFPQKIQNIARLLEGKLNRAGFHFRTLDFKNFSYEIETLRPLYNNSNKDNRGFIPMSKTEFLHMAYNLRKVVPKELVLIVEKENEMVGFLLTVPDINQILIRIKNGKLFPSGLFTLVLNKNRITSARLTILGVDEEYRNIGIDICLYTKLFHALSKLNITNTEACYVIETNKMMKSIINKANGKLVKTYRIYNYDTF